ncbi:lysophospholipase [Opitutaceae bacterium TAV4]|nr:lysophospholipase [Opitutaceae bacterium TAV4]RRK02441.1 lysophospholipase [Opitutaceae bacterium TAV3]
MKPPCPAFRQIVAALLFVCSCAVSVGTSSLSPDAPGRDVVEAFAQAARGEPLRYVAIGGSITQASGPGWVGGWLRGQFPQSNVTVVNSGMSATGSALGIFRAERDIIAHQPDLVAIEYCVNDGSLTDEQCIRYMETLVVRLKSLPQPPAIVILEAAAKNGVNLARHRKVARHYGLLEVDFQAAVDAHLRAAGTSWETLFSDSVHPNKEGHAFYAGVMAKALQPLIEEARNKPGLAAVVKLPAQLSAKPLLLDARMVPLQGWNEASGAWRSENAPNSWYGRFFQGVLSADKPGAVLQIPFRGTAVGLFYALHKDFGSFYASVDGGMPAHVFTNNRHGYTLHVAADDLPAREHVLTVVLPSEAAIAGTPAGADDLKVGGAVKLGYLLVAGESEATRERSPAGAFDAGRLQTLRFETIPAARWSWTGPFPVQPGVDGKTPVDASRAIGQKFLSESGEGAPTFADWRTIDAEGSRVDFRALTGSDEPGVAYAATQFESAQGGAAILSVEVDYFAHLWLNGQRVLTLEGPHRVPIFLPVTLRPGSNELVIKVGAGSAGFNHRVRVAQ